MWTDGVKSVGGGEKYRHWKFCHKLINFCLILVFIKCWVYEPPAKPKITKHSPYVGAKVTFWNLCLVSTCFELGSPGEVASIVNKKLTMTLKQFSSAWPDYAIYCWLMIPILPSVLFVLTGVFLVSAISPSVRPSVCPVTMTMSWHGNFFTSLAIC